MQWWIQLSEVIRNVGLLFGGGIGLYLAWLRVTAANQQADASLRQAELTRREHVAELFNRAVGQLGDAKLEVRLAAIYTLRQIGQDFPDLTSAVFELLNAYLRENPRDYGDAEPPIDIQEIMSIIRRGSDRTRLE
jgi:hypothetical protein